MSSDLRHYPGIRDNDWNALNKELRRIVDQLGPGAAAVETGYVLLYPGGFAPDGTGSGNDPATESDDVSTAAQTTNTPKATAKKLSFDGTTDEHWMFSFLIPGNYGSGATLRGICKFTSATSGTAVMKAGQVTTAIRSDDDDALAFELGNLSTAILAPATQGLVVPFTIDLTQTGMAASRLCRMFIGRDPDHTDDTITTDLELLALTFEYTLA